MRTGFDVRLVFRLARHPVWLLGIASMIGGFVFQITALHFGDLALLLGSATGISWGFMAAVIKELSSHLGDGIGAIFSTWSLYVLIAAGAATMLLASHALAAGPLAASQPGFTILDPLAASLLGVFLLGEHLRTGAWNLAGEALALAVVVAGAVVLSRSCLTLGEDEHPSCLGKPAMSKAADVPTRTDGLLSDRELAAAGRGVTPRSVRDNQTSLPNGLWLTTMPGPAIRGSR